jgi:peroxiredoxin
VNKEKGITMAVDTPVCEFGWKAKPFSLMDPDGNKATLESIAGDRGTLIAFICNHCPYVKAVVDRMVEDIKILQADGIGVAAIMSNDYVAYPDDHPDLMRSFAATHGFTFPYLVDEDQSVARDYDAVCTPDFFGFNADLELQYRGRLDDARMGDPAGRKTELLDAMRMIAKNGEGPRQQIASMGCSIKWR